jgi:hypothetical protein
MGFQFRTFVKSDLIQFDRSPRVIQELLDLKKKDKKDVIPRELLNPSLRQVAKSVVLD